MEMFIYNVVKIKIIIFVFIKLFKANMFYTEMHREKLNKKKLKKLRDSIL